MNKTVYGDAFIALKLESVDCKTQHELHLIYDWSVNHGMKSLKIISPDNLSKRVLSALERDWRFKKTFVKRYISKTRGVRNVKSFVLYENPIEPKKISISEQRKKFIKEHPESIKNFLKSIHENHPMNKPENRLFHSQKMKEKNPMYNPEYVKKASESIRKNWKDPEYAKRIVQSQHRCPNKPELKLLFILDYLCNKEYEFCGNGELFIDGKNPDFINCNGKKKIIEMFGDYWHKDDNGYARCKFFNTHGYDCLIIRENELKNIETLSNKIINYHNKTEIK